MNKLIENVKDYIFIPSGETIRAAEIVILSSAVQVVGNIDRAGDIRTYAIAFGIAAINAAVAFIKGRIPPSKPVPKE